MKKIIKIKMLLLPLLPFLVISMASANTIGTSGNLQSLWDSFTTAADMTVWQWLAPFASAILMVIGFWIWNKDKTQAGLCILGSFGILSALLIVSAFQNSVETPKGIKDIISNSRTR